MADVQKLTSYILKKAHDEAAKLIEEAQSESNEIISGAQKEASISAEEILSHARREASDIERRAYSALSQKKNRSVLELKNRAIEDALKSAADKISSMPDSEYCDLLCRMLRNNATGQTGIISFSESDVKRINSELKALIDEKSLTLEKEPVNISGGFVLKYGQILINCSLEAIFKENYEQFTDCISKALFG